MSVATWGSILAAIACCFLPLLVKRVLRHRNLEPVADVYLWALALVVMLVVLSKTLALVMMDVWLPEHLSGKVPRPQLQNRTQPWNLAPRAVVKEVDSYWQALPQTAPSPADNPPSLAKVELGKKLFFDRRLSRGDQISCAGCHSLNQSLAGADGLPVSKGVDDQPGSRNAPTVYNAAFQRLLFWDGRANSLEEQALGPLVNPVEMAMPSAAAVEQKLRGIDEYPALFESAFADELGTDEEAITAKRIAQAIASYERTLITSNSPYDRFVRGDRSALSESQQRGMSLFRSLGCAVCHSGPNFSAASIFSTGSGYRVFPVNRDEELEQRYDLIADRGHYNSREGSSEQGERGAWRVPSLRNVALTAPYFHNGSVATLEEAVRVMARLQLGIRLEADAPQEQWRAFWSESEGRFYASAGNVLSNQDVDDLVAFLEGLSDID